MDKDPINIEQLIAVALKGLHQMFVPNENLFCYSMESRENSCRGISLRYSMISLIGLAKAKSADYEIRLPIKKAMNTIFERRNQISHAGDVGLFLWADALCGTNLGQQIFDMVKQYPKQHLKRILAMELAWMLTGLSFSYTVYESKALRTYAQTVACLLKTCFNEASCLFRQHCQPNPRSMFPNFANEIYPIHALSKYGTIFSDRHSLDIAAMCANRLSQLQGKNGEWGWLYNEKHGTLVDLYAVYSVHQDGMAPMALFALEEAMYGARRTDFSLSITKGLKWIYGENELGENLVGPKENVIYREIYRQNPLVRYKNLFISLFGKTSTNPLKNGSRKINSECRPYHLGWILEAWCGRG